MIIDVQQGLGPRCQHHGGRKVAEGRLDSGSAAQTIACHSGEKLAYGQNAASFGWSGAYANSASGGSIPSARTQRSSGSASAGPSISTASGWNASSAATSDRADPGP